MTKQFTKNARKAQWIKVDDIDVVWSTAQRPIKEPNVTRIVENFDPDLFGVPAVTVKNGHGRHHVIDGQHRVTALKRMGWGDQQVLCVVHDTHDAAAAARMFDGLNTAVKPGPLDRFNVRVAAGYPAECRIKEIVEAAGWAIDSNPQDGHFAAVSSAQLLHDRYGEAVLIRTLDVITKAWGLDRDGMHNCIVKGLGEFISHSPDLERLADRLAKEGKPRLWLGKARTSKDLFKGSLASNVTRVVTERYNAGLRTGRIEL